jgi:hypothetical protein
MTRYSMTGQGHIVPFTPEEEAEADASEAKDAAIEAAEKAAAPMREWEEAMVATDSLMTRDVEDLIDNLILTEILTEEQLSTRLAEYRTLKKNERNKKPVVL